MPKISFEQANAFACSQKYEGDYSAVGLAKWLKTFPADAVVQIDQKEYPISELEIEEVKADRKVYSIPATVATTAGSTSKLPGFDDDAIKAVVEARVSKALADAGLRIVNGRLIQGDPGITKVAVKSGDQRMYEDKIARKEARFSTYEDALLFKHWIASQLCGFVPGQGANAVEHFKRFGETFEQIHSKAYSTTSSTQGAATVPEIFRPDLIRLVDSYGAFSQLTEVIRTNQPQLLIPRRTGGLTAYWPAENSAITASTGTYDNVALNAKTVAVLCSTSVQLLNDSGLNMADKIAQEIATSISQVKDQCLMIGDSTATYGGMTGFDKLYGTTAGTTGYAVTGATTADAHTHANLCTAIGRLPAYVLRGGNVKWTCTPSIAANVFYRLSTSTQAGGLTYSDLTGRFVGSMYAGFPIVLNNVMNATVDASTMPSGYTNFTTGDIIDILIGDFTMASKMLDLLDISIESDTSYGFNTYSVYFRGVARFHSVVHDVGTSTTAGPVVSFWQT